MTVFCYQCGSTLYDKIQCGACGTRVESNIKRIFSNTKLGKNSLLLLPNERAQLASEAKIAVDLIRRFTY